MSESEARILTYADPSLREPDGTLKITFVGPSQGTIRTTKRESPKLKSTPARERELMVRAAREAGKGEGSVQRFCEFLDRDKIPMRGRYAHAKSWADAYKNPEHRSSVRGLKLRAV